MTMSTVKTKEKVAIRSMNPEDISSIIDIDQKLTGVQRALDHIDIITGDMGGSLDLSFVAEVDSQVIGFVLARQVYVGEPVMPAGVIRIIGVDPEYRKQGIATRLVNAVVDLCTLKGIKAVRVIVGEKDSRIEGFFKHLGFGMAKLKVYNKSL
jgi:predicted N-acetyltransferase YhbS